MTYLRQNGRVQRCRRNPRYYMLLGTNLNQFTLGGLSARFLNLGFAFNVDVLAVPRFTSKTGLQIDLQIYSNTYKKIAFFRKILLCEANALK